MMRRRRRRAAAGAIISIGAAKTVCTNDGLARGN